MPVLLLARGDKEGRDLLRKALEARYGLGAPAIDTLKIQFEGRIRTRLGPITTWVPLETTTYFAFPGRGRWDFSLRAAGVPLRSGANAFDGTAYRKRQRHNDVEIVTDPELVRAARLWLYTASGILLTPLAEQFIELRGTGARSFEAINLETRDSILVTLREDYTVNTVSTTCPNPEQDNREQLFTFQTTDSQVVVNDLMLPAKITTMWDNMEENEVKPMAVELNPPLSNTLFTLESET